MSAAKSTGEAQGTPVESFSSLRKGDVIRETNCPACGGEHIVTLTKLGTFTDDDRRRAGGQRWRKGWQYKPDCRPGEKGFRAITERLIAAGWIYLVRSATTPNVPRGTQDEEP
ncbi:MAG: hypothetical protein EPN98_21690 [Phenylobacterium sp.]|uniref:hypothetical protein n=1 Tax=Phenylobacterium sp. TaxID=1871053 RepID=UPI0012020332|nr:hypothetical protein [Phenylobacterium sp.]TAL29058.1 MAG: hypothetical protein EPN98_21690 [Phenylobacterium sp.]